MWFSAYVSAAKRTQLFALPLSKRDYHNLDPTFISNTITLSCFLPSFCIKAVLCSRTWKKEGTYASDWDHISMWFHNWFTSCLLKRRSEKSGIYNAILDAFIFRSGRANFIGYVSRGHHFDQKWHCRRMSPQIIMCSANFIFFALLGIVLCFRTAKEVIQRCTCSSQPFDRKHCRFGSL